MRSKRKFPLVELLLLALGGRVLGQHAEVNQTCDPTANHLDPATHKLISNCDDKTFCSSSTKTCQSKQCRTSAIPFGYGPDQPAPKLCPDGFYCPDAQDQCQPLLPLGHACELNRDGRSFIARCRMSPSTDPSVLFLMSGR